MVPASPPCNPPRSPTPNTGAESSLFWQSSEEPPPARPSQRKVSAPSVQRSDDPDYTGPAAHDAPPPPLYVRRKRQAAASEGPWLEAENPPPSHQPPEASNGAGLPRKVRLKRSRTGDAAAQVPPAPQSPPKRRSGPWVEGDTVEEILAPYLVPPEVLAVRPVATGQLRDCTDADTPRECGLCGGVYRLIFFKRSPGGKIGYCTRCDRLRSRCSHHKVRTAFLER